MDKQVGMQIQAVLQASDGTADTIQDCDWITPLHVADVITQFSQDFAAFFTHMLKLILK
jgi:hypothetical protein